MSQYFTEDELACSHTGDARMCPAFMAKLDRLREAMGVPLYLSSAYRDVSHPSERHKATHLDENGIQRAGAHTYGRAVDVSVRGAQAHKLLTLALASGDFTGVGVARSFVHLDDLELGHFNRPTVWTYD